MNQYIAKLSLIGCLMIAPISSTRAANAAPTWPANLVAGDSLLGKTPGASDWKLDSGVVAKGDTYTFTSEENNLLLAYKRSLALPFAFQCRIKRLTENHIVRLNFPDLELCVTLTKQFQCLSIAKIDPENLSTKSEIAKIPYASLRSKVTSMDDFTLTVALGKTQYAIWMDGQPIFVGEQPIKSDDLSTTFNIFGGWSSNFELSALKIVNIKSLQFPVIK